MLYAVSSLGTINIDVFKFSGGEVQVKLKETPVSGTPLTLVSMPTSSDGIMATFLAIDAIKRTCNPSHLTLNLLYLPYARQDRQCEKGEAFSLQVFCKLLNAMNINSVLLYDPHSDVSPALIDNCQIIDQTQCFGMVLDNNPEFNKLVKTEKAVLVSPDAGANKKTLSLCKRLKKSHFIRADKVRDTVSGAITDTTVLADDLTDIHCIIVDDICDGGGTFTALAKKLKEKNAASVTLYVTHGIFSKGKQVLFDNGIDNVYALYDWTNLKDK